MNDNSHITETLTPADQAAVAEAVRNAAAQGMAVYPIGGGTMLDYGAKPTRPGIGLSLAKLNRVIDYPAADLTITVEAGMTIAELTKRLAAQRQRLPIDVPQPDRATVGGAVAVNAAGPRRYAYGTMRDYVLGFTAVDGTGTMFSGGGRVVKNAAGYNMCRLMAGSLGTLGVITQVTLMVRPLPEASVLLRLRRARFRRGRATAGRLGPLAGAARGHRVRWPVGHAKTTSRWARCSKATLAGCTSVSRDPRPRSIGWSSSFATEWAAAGATAPMLVPTTRAEPLWRWLADFPADVQINVLPSADGRDRSPNC